MADADTNADIKAFLKAAGVEQYTDKLLEEGFDSLSTMLLLDEAGLQDLKAAVNMKAGHLAALRTSISRKSPPGAPLHPQFKLYGPNFGMSRFAEYVFQRCRMRQCNSTVLSVRPPAPRARRPLAAPDRDLAHELARNARSRYISL